MSSAAIFQPGEWPEVFDAKELARILGVSESTARRYMARDDFPVTTLSPRIRRIRRDDLRKWLEKQTG